MMHMQHPQIAVECLRELGGMFDSPIFGGSVLARDLDGVMSFEPFLGRLVEKGAPAVSGVGPAGASLFPAGLAAEHEAQSRVERHHSLRNVFSRLSESGRALVRSQAGPGGGLARAASQVWIFACSECFWFVVSCSVHGHHRAACARGWGWPEGGSLC